MQRDTVGGQAGLVFVQHQCGDFFKVFFAQRVEGDDLVHAADELGAQELLQRLHAAVRAGDLCLFAKACCPGCVGGACVGRHADDRVGKVHRATLGVVDLALVQNLQQDIHDVRMCFFDFVKQHDTVRMAAHLLGQLPGLVVADWYTNNGSLYMTSLAFLPLGLPASHPFWTDAPQEWTSVRAWGEKPFPKDHHWKDEIRTWDLF